MHDLKFALEALVKYLYKRRATIGSAEDRPLATADGILVLPNSLPDEVTRNLRSYRKEGL